jgi:hypothetical protein
MRTIIAQLLFDSEVVEAVKKTEIDNAKLYNYLIEGKITMQEYLQLCKA